VLAFRPRTASARPGATAYTVGLEEQVMVLDPQRWELVTDLAPIVGALPGGLTATIDCDAHAPALELRTHPHATVGAAVTELGSLRGRLTAALGRAGLRAAVAGAHPAAEGPTFALHVHVAIADDGRAPQTLARMHAHLPLLVALSANSPFVGGRETGCASARIDHATGEPVGARLCPQHGTLEIRVMDAQTRLADVAALAALAQCLVCEERTRRPRRTDRRADTRAIAGDLRAAARLGMRARLGEPPRPARQLAAELVGTAAPHATALGCTRELEHVAVLAARPGEAFQRGLARLRPGEAAGGLRLRRLTGEMSAAFLET
jgi:carboxylate-amine ligase